MATRVKDSPDLDDLDRGDRRILRLLQGDGRLGNAEIARRLSMSPATCHRRTQRLFADGHIQRVTARIAPAKVGRGTLVLVGVVLDRSTPDSFSAFEKAAKSLPLVIDCHLVAGDFDYFLKLRLRDLAEFSRFHGEKLITLPGVRQTRTFFVMREVVEGAPLDF